jgi:hypothetical protein
VAVACFAVVIVVVAFLTTDAEGAGVTDELGLFTPAADARRPLPLFFVLDEVWTVSTGRLVGILPERSLARVRGWDWACACEWVWTWERWENELLLAFVLAAGSESGAGCCGWCWRESLIRISVCSDKGALAVAVEVDPSSGKLPLPSAVA